MLFYHNNKNEAITLADRQYIYITIAISNPIIRSSLISLLDENLSLSFVA